MYCDLCNKNTVDKHFDRHCNSQKHIENEKRRLFCFKCKRKYSNIDSYNKNKKKCKNIDKLNKLDKLDKKNKEESNKPKNNIINNDTKMIVNKIDDVNENVNIVKIKVD